MKYNKHDLSIIFIISLLAFGGIGGASQPVRIFSLLLMLLLLRQFLSPSFIKQNIYPIFLFIVWYSYALISMIWTPAPEEGIKQLVYYFIHFGMFLILPILSSKAENPFRSLVFGWLLAASLTMPLAFYEVLTNNHLDISRFDSDAAVNTGSLVLALRFASTTFDNFNNYSAFLIYAVFFLFAGLLSNCSKQMRIFLLLNLMLIFYILFLNFSRGAIISLSLLLITFLFRGASSSDGFGMKGMLVFGALLFLVGLFSIQYLDLDSYRFSYRLEAETSFQEDARFLIYLSAFNAIVDSYFIGTGIGSEFDVLTNYGSPVPNSHNLFLEIILQYGLIIILGFLGLVAKIVIKLSKCADSPVKFLGNSFFLCLLPIFVVCSGYLLQASFWLFMGSLYSISQMNGSRNIAQT